MSNTNIDVVVRKQVQVHVIKIAKGSCRLPWETNQQKHKFQHRIIHKRSEDTGADAEDSNMVR